ncbi:MAG: serine/threonine protein kinase [Deltaproteobacteria bacterium]|nr:MAG: serine/threonine protein kinase [Deltaproteobacteria bacterium]
MSFDGPLLRDRYRLGPPLGAGGQGRTFAAVDTADGDRVVAIKRLALGDGTSWKQFDLFEREVRVLERLHHPGIPRYLDHFEGDPPGTFYLVMERAPGRPLSDAHTLSESALRAILIRALGILAYLHSRTPPVIHRDIKPANLLWADDGRVSLVDFGGVRDALRTGGGSTVVGTFGYMAPEQLHGQAMPATDLYGLGATAVALAGGIEPEHVPRNGLRMDLRAHLRDLSPDLVDVLAWMTDPDPDARPQSAKDVLRRLARPAPRAGRPSAAASDGAAAPDATAPDAAATSAAHRDATGDGDTPRGGAAPEDAPVSHGDDDEPLLDLEMSEPLRSVAGVLLAIVGWGGTAALWLVQRALLPIAFALVSAFVSGDGRRKLDGARATTDRALDGARRGFRRLRGAHRRPRALPSHPPDPS